MTDFIGGGGDDTFVGSENDDNARGGGGADTLIGNGGNDVLAGEAGADAIDGGAGIDTAVFSGNVSDYSVQLNNTTGAVTIIDLRTGSPDGADILWNIEKFQFANGIFVLDALLSGHAHGDGIFYGNPADDIFHCSEQGDLILGYLGNDIIYGYGGDDSLYGEDGADYLDGGAGADYLYSTAGISVDETLYSWNVYWERRWTTFSIDAGIEVDTLKGGSGEDDLYAGYGDNIDGGADVDTLFINFRGASSGVTADFRSNSNVVGGGIITNIEFVAMVVGSDFDDDITLGTYIPPYTPYFFSSGGVVFGLGGNDRLVAGYFTDSLFGDDGNDVVDGSGSYSLRRVDGGEGDDRLMIAALANTTDVIGGAGFDTFAISGAVSVGGVLDGIEALELISGASLTLTGTQFAMGLANNTVVSGTGTITVNMNSDVNFSAAGMSFAGTGVAMVVNGTSGVDIIKLGLGNSSGNTVNGGDGVDQIRGSQMVDTINGEGGNDKIMGLGGADVLTGGAGNDQFRYFSAADSGLGANADRITDFIIASDRINFALIDADAATAGDQAFAFIGTAAFAANGVGQVRYTNSGADLAVQADVNGDGIADMEIILQGLNGQALTNADFIL